MLPPSLNAMFEKDLQNGQLQELVLNRWYPWWKRELVNLKESENDDSNGDANINIDIDNKNENENYTFSKTLDERLLRVPNFAGLGGKNRGGSSRPTTTVNKNDDALLYNLVDILYATCRTLRLYHGVENASRQAPVEAATTLIATSSVLGKDTRFTTISQVLNNCCAVESSLNNNNNNNNKEETLFEDIASLVTLPRLVGRAILEASDILKAAIKELKSDDNDKSSVSNEYKNERDDNETKLKQIRRLRKKLQFFLSWTTHHPVAVDLFLGGGPKEEILAWVDERKQLILEYEDNNEDINSNKNIDCLDYKDNIKSLKLPPSAASTSRPSNLLYKNDDGNDTTRSEITMHQPLMVEVQSRLKK